jgi:hypothetical protein
LLLRLLAQLDTIRPWDISRNDLNQNGVLDVGDAIKLLLAVVQGASASPTGWPEEGGFGGGTAAERAVLSPARTRVASGQNLFLMVQLESIQTPVSGAAFRLVYPATALRLVDAQTHQPDTIVPTAAIPIWHVTQENASSNQIGVVTLAVSSGSPWPRQAGVLAWLNFEVLPGAGAQFLWSVSLQQVEITSDGFDLRLLQTAAAQLEGRGPVPGSLLLLGWNRSGPLRMTLHGDPGAAYEVESSEDLLTWIRLSTVLHTALPPVITDQAAASVRQRFYRCHPMD